MFHQFFPLAQVKRSVIISSKPGIYELSHELPNNFKTSWNYTLVPSLPPKNKTLSILAKEYLKTEIELFP